MQLNRNVNFQFAICNLQFAIASSAIVRRLPVCAPTFLVAFALAGCGYSTRGLYPTDIRTVAVPVVESQLLRRDLEFPLTQKIIQAIESQTPYKVVASQRADTELRCTLSNAVKLPYGEDGFNNPRGGTMVYSLKVVWIDKRSGDTIKEGAYKLDQSVNFEAVESFAVDLGQSNATANNSALNRLADQVVSVMQAPW